MLEIAGCHVEKISRDDWVASSEGLKAMTPDQAKGRINHRFCRKSMLTAIH